MKSGKTSTALVLLFSLNITIAGQAMASDCFESAAAYQGINSGVLRAISIKENRRCDATISKNTNGSVDIGCMQINSIHLKELSTHGVSQQDLLDQCKNIYVGAWHYKKMIRKYGDTWMAVGAYHSETPKFRDPYAADVRKIWIKYGLDKLAVH
ncbi:lytic transglycosylase domain-containing protein [Glaciimonas sp. GG7]